MVALLLALAVTAQDTTYARVWFRNNGGVLRLYRHDSLGTQFVRFHLSNQQGRTMHVEWTRVLAASGALAVEEVLRVYVPLRADTLEQAGRAPGQGNLTTRCQRDLGCWWVMTNVGRGGYWRPEPTVTRDQMILLARAARNAANAAAVPPYLLDLRSP